MAAVRRVDMVNFLWSFPAFLCCYLNCANCVQYGSFPLILDDKMYQFLFIKLLYKIAEKYKKIVRVSSLTQTKSYF